ncbi:hypothetical protein ACLOJK_032892 [Asimina triloba]
MQSVVNCIVLVTLASLEFWAFVLRVLLSGFLPNPELETSMLSISVINTCTMLFMIPYGLRCAVRVSNELGAGHPQAARLAVLAVVAMVVIVGVVVGSVMLLVRGILGYAYSNEAEMVKYVSIMMPVLATSNFFDGMQSVLVADVDGRTLVLACSCEFHVLFFWPLSY